MVDSTFLRRPNVSDRRFNTLRHPSGFYLRIDEVDLRQIEKSISYSVGSQCQDWRESSEPTERYGSK